MSSKLIDKNILKTDVQCSGHVMYVSSHVNQTKEWPLKFAEFLNQGFCLLTLMSSTVYYRAKF